MPRELPAVAPLTMEHPQATASEDSRSERRPLTSEEWLRYFADNENRRLSVPWQRGAEISEQERHRIARSLQAWQLGETSDGSHLLAHARRFAHRVGDPLLVDAVRLFIREEQRHGADLGRFLDLAGIPRARRNWGDTLFRLARYTLPSLEIWTSVVIMVETIALTYYRAIRDATGSPVLRQICRQILRDEPWHIRFQYERLACCQRSRPAWLRVSILALYRALFGAVAAAVWIDHRRALRAGGFDLRRYWRQVWSDMERAWSRLRDQAGVGVGFAPRRTSAEARSRARATSTPRPAQTKTER